ncbi:MAG: hypothetical protein EB127_24180, partial [Alphaproteobacteria bacterium]|nr:hypothetical protein [Alphaproteobacteria bacterium]
MVEGSSHVSMEMDDLVDSGDNVTCTDETVVEGTKDVNSCIKMKLNSFLRDGHRKVIAHKLNQIVSDGNILLSEAYAFANYFILKRLELDGEMPLIDRNFYYRCLCAVGTNKCRKGTIDDLQDEISVFDTLRLETSSESRIQTSEYNVLLATLSIQMSTMATNHLLC